MQRMAEGLGRMNVENILETRKKVKQSHYRPEQALWVPGGWSPRF
jgi:hypothetical protein